MSNTLERRGTTYLLPAVQPVAAQPAYTSYDTIAVTVPSSPGAPAGWGYKTVFAPDGSSSVQLVYLGNLNANQGVSAALAPPAYTTTYQTVATYHPAVTAVAGSPAVRVNDPPFGWVSFGHTIASVVATGTATWIAPYKATGTAVGLSPTTNPTVGYGHILHGLLHSAGTVRNLTTGASYGAYVVGDVFTMVATGSTITYKKNGTTIGSEANDMGAQTLYLAAALYGVGDQVDTPTLTQYYGGGATTTMRTLTSFSGKSSHFQAITSMLPLTGRSRVGNDAYTSMRWMHGTSADRPYAQSIGTMKRMTGSAYGGTLTVASNVYSDTVMNNLIGAAHMFTGQLGHGNMSMLPMTGISVHAGYASAVGVMKPLRSLSGVQPASSAYIAEVIGTSAPVTGTYDLVALVMAGMNLGVTAVPSLLIPAVIQEIIHGTIGLATSQLLNAIVNAMITAGVTYTAPGADGENETWVVNLDGYGSTSYSNYDFNSFAKINGQYFGANESGIFLLDGDTDNGDPIHASVSLGERDFGTTQKKTVSECYVGMSGAGNLFVKIIANGASYIYSTRNFTANMQQQRVTFGKGLRTNYVTLEIYNQDGADFELNTVEFQVADLTRRI